MKLATSKNYSDEDSAKFHLACTDKHLTQQADDVDTDINVIVAKHGGIARIPAPLKTPMTGDFTNVTDYRANLERITRAQAEFDALPAKTRKEFDYDPAKFLEAVTTPGHEADLERLGLLDKTQKTLDNKQETPKINTPDDPPAQTEPRK